MTLDEIEAQVLLEVGDLATSGNYFSEAQIANWIYEAELRIARVTDSVDATDTSETTTAGTAGYNVAADELSIQKVEIAGNFITPITFAELALIDSKPSTANSAGIPIYWYFREDKVNFYPAPANTGDQITIYYKKYPTKLVTGANSPTIPVEFHPQLITYCLARAKETLEESQDAMMLMARFESELLEITFEEQHGDEPSYPAVQLVAGDEW